MQTLIRRFRQTLFFRETMYFIWKIENLNVLQSPWSWIFSAEIFHTFSTYQYLQNGVQDFVLFCFDFELFAKIKSTCCQETRRNQIFETFINNPRSKQNKKSRTCFCRHRHVRKLLKLQQKTVNSMVVTTCQSFTIF